MHQSLCYKRAFLEKVLRAQVICGSAETWTTQEMEMWIILECEILRDKVSYAFAKLGNKVDVILVCGVKLG